MEDLCVASSSPSPWPRCRPSSPRRTRQASDRLTLDLYWEYETVSDPQLSPDGSQIIYTRQWIDRVNDKRESSLWIMGADGAKNRVLVRGSNARWSPSGDRILYTAQGEPRGSQIFVRYMDAEGAVSQITHVLESPANVTWAPDGQSIAFTMKVEKKNVWSIKMPSGPRAPSGPRPRALSSASTTARTARASTTMAIGTCSRCRPPAARRDS